MSPCETSPPVPTRTTFTPRSPVRAVIVMSFASASVVDCTSVAVTPASESTRIEPLLATTLVSVVTPSLRSSTFPVTCALIARNSTGVVPRLFT